MKRAIATDYIPANIWAIDETYGYGQNTDSPVAQHLIRVAHGSRTVEVCHDFGTGYQLTNAKIITTDQDGEVFAVIKEVATSYFALWRSGDYGQSFRLVHDFSETGGARLANRYVLERALCIGYPGGVRTYAMAEYYTAAADAPCRILTSPDGITWTVQATVTGGSSSGLIRHWHAMRWNPYTERWCLGSGDNDAQNVVLTTADLTLITNAAPSVLVGLDGVTGAYGTQHHRTVDFLFTPQAIFTSSDTISGALEHRGIFRWSHDLTVCERVDSGEGRYETGSNRNTGWTGCKADGHLLWGTYQQTEVAGHRHLEIYGAEIGKDGRGQWRELGRIYTRQGRECDIRGFWYHAASNQFGVCFGSGAGKQTQNETVLFRLEGVFQDDYLGAAPGTGEPLYVPDTLHPVYWLDAENGSDSNDGYTPDTPWRTIQFALQGGTGSGAVSISGDITESSGTATLNGAADLTALSVGGRFTISGNANAAYNKTFVVATKPTSSRITFKCDSGAGTGAGGTVNDVYSNVTYGGLLRITGRCGVAQGFNIQIDKFPWGCSVSGTVGFSGEAGHPLQIIGDGIETSVLYDSAALSSVGLFTLNTSGDFLITEGLHAYHTRSAASARVIYPAVAGAKWWARDCKLGHESYNAEAWRNGASNDGDHYLLRCHIVGDTAGGAVNQPGVEIDGTARVFLIGCLIESTYRGVRKRTAGTGLVMRGCLVRGFSQNGIDTATDNTGSWDVSGCVVVRADGSSSAGVDSGTGTMAAGHRTEHNLFLRTPTRARDQGASNIDMQTAGTALADYFVDGDPRLGPKQGSPLLGAGQWVGAADYSGAARGNPGAIGHLELPVQIIRVYAERAACSRAAVA